MSKVIEGKTFASEEKHDQFLKKQLSRFLEGKPVYKSTDVPVIDSTVVLPGHDIAVRIALKPRDLPILDKVHVSALDYLKKSVKSRGAQRGLNVGGTDGMSTHIYTSGQDFEYSEELEAYIAMVRVSNHSLRPTTLKAGTGLYRYYYLNEANKLSGKNLVQAVDRGAIQIESGWGYTGSNSESGEFVPTGLYVDIDPSTFRAVNPFNQNPIEVPNDAPNFGRAEIDMHLNKPILLPVRQLLIGETPHMKLAPDINIELKATTSTRNESLSHVAAGRQINSCLLDGGVTDHKVRVEVVDFTYPSINPHRLYMDAYRSII